MKLKNTHQHDVQISHTELHQNGQPICKVRLNFICAYNWSTGFNAFIFTKFIITQWRILHILWTELYPNREKMQKMGQILIYALTQGNPSRFSTYADGITWRSSAIKVNKIGPKIHKIRQSCMCVFYRTESHDTYKFPTSLRWNLLYGISSN